MTNIKEFFKRIKKRENLLEVIVFFISIGISLLIFIYRNNFKELGNFEYLGIFLLSIIGNSTVIVPAPVFLTALVGGSILNPFAVGIVTASGATIGELTGYFTGFGGKIFIKEDKRYKKIKYFMNKNGFLTIFILAAIPNPLFDLAGIFSGLTNYPLRKFILATFLGKSLKFISIAILGMKVGSINF